jgi:hypothetical protein
MKRKSTPRIKKKKSIYSRLKKKRAKRKLIPRCKVVKLTEEELAIRYPSPKYEDDPVLNSFKKMSKANFSKKIFGCILNIPNKYREWILNEFISKNRTLNEEYKTLTITLFKKESSILSNKDCYPGLVFLVNNRKCWVRNIKSRKIKTNDPFRQMNSLIKHLLDKHNEIPEFVIKYTYQRIPLALTSPIKLFNHLREGKNISSFKGFPGKLTKVMAKVFYKCDYDFTIEKAYRYSQIKGLGGRSELVKEIYNSLNILGDDFTKEKFWISLFRLFIANPMMDVALVQPIIEFCRYKVGHLNQMGAEPDYSLKGKSIRTLIREMNQWHGILSSEEVYFIRWEPLPIDDYFYKTKNDEYTYIFEQILNSRKLNLEGKMMHHCVYTYYSSCLNGNTSIWTLYKTKNNYEKKLLTIEVSPNRTILQARGAYNRILTKFEFSLINIWAKNSGLKVSEHFLDDNV